MSRVFWDTNLFIYLLEEGSFTEQVVLLRQRMLDRGDQLLTSALTLGEVLVKPLIQGRGDLASRYGDLISSGSTVLPFEALCARRYAEIRRDRAIAPSDAIQLACAAAAGVDLFITNDDRLSKKIVPGIHFVSSLAHAYL